MKDFSLKQWLVILVLSLLTALEPLSIDLYLPGFLSISETFRTTTQAVQISLSTFLGGFAIGQLFWGPLADRFGRKKPILLSLFIFIIASIGCIYVHTIEQMWIMRFIQAIGGCGGIVISRAVVTDYFDRSKTLKIYSLLALIMGVAPIIAPVIGNAVLKYLSWEGLFEAMAALGILLFLLTLFCLPETHQKKAEVKAGSSVLKDYWSILNNRKFVVYALIAGIVNGALMIYVANGPFLIMEKGGFSSDGFSIVFSVNAFGLMVSSYLTNVFQKYVPTNKLVKQALFFMFMMSIILLFTMYIEADIFIMLIALFFYIFPIGILFPTTTELAITPFANTNSSGTASALFGSIQLLMAFICSVVSNFVSNGTVVSVGIAFFLCTLLSFIIVFIRLNPREEYSRESLR